MFDQVMFTGTDHASYVMLREPSLEEPWPGRKYFERVDAREAVRVVLGAISDRHGSPNWGILELLGIRQHPRTLHPHALRAQVTSLVGDGYSRRFRLYQRLESAPPLRQLAPRTSDPQPEAGRSTLLDFFSLELVDEEDRAVAGFRFELAFADGEHRVVVTDPEGKAHLEQIAAGTCSASPSASSSPAAGRSHTTR